MDSRNTAPKAPCPDAGAANAVDADLVDRWQRIRMVVRCGLSIRHADYVRLYLLIGRRIARRGIRAPGAAQRSMLDTLLQTARDPALPRPLRRACLEHAPLLLAQLEALFGFHDAAALRAVEAEVRRAGDPFVPSPRREA